MANLSEPKATHYCQFQYATTNNRIPKKPTAIRQNSN